MSIAIENQELFRTLTVHDRQLIVADVRHDNYHSGDIVFPKVSPPMAYIGWFRDRSKRFAIVPMEKKS
ncbi:MAG: hypothetical protein OEM52_04135 [bacterium]|nr:hypothetical protein [bacterium]